MDVRGQRKSPGDELDQHSVDVSPPGIEMKPPGSIYFLGRVCCKIAKGCPESRSLALDSLLAKHSASKVVVSYSLPSLSPHFLASSAFSHNNTTTLWRQVRPRLLWSRARI